MRLIIPALVFLAACTPTEDTGPEHEIGSCGAADRADLIGQSVETVDTEALADAVRILPPGAMMTMDHRLDRLNIDTDDTGVITRLWCG